MDKTAEFLRLFKELEERLVIISGLGEDYVSFSRALDKVRFSKLNPVVADEENYQFLRTASDLRNILSHENDVCLPSDSFVERFQAVAGEIINPLTAYDICTRGAGVITASYETSVLELTDAMAKRHLSHVPIIEDGKTVGVFSSTTFFQRFARDQELLADKNTKISDFGSEVGFDSHLNEIYLFVGRETKAFSLIRYFTKAKAGDKRVSCIFVTEHGRKSERLIGIITEADLLKLPIYERKMLRAS